MGLWDIIRDWFVLNIWGGYTSDFEYHSGGFLGDFATADNYYENGRVGNIYIPFSNVLNGDTDTVYSYISLGDWLSTTSTIIVLIAICVGFYFLVRWLFRLTAGLIAGRG